MSTRDAIVAAALAFDNDASDEHLQALRDACSAYERTLVSGKFLTVTAQQVRIGDRVFDAAYYMPDKWRAVTEIRITAREVSLITSDVVHAYHPREAVTVAREHKT